MYMYLHMHMVYMALMQRWVKSLINRIFFKERQPCAMINVNNIDFIAYIVYSSL